MLLFAVVGLASAQTTPAADIKITVPAGKTVKVKMMGWDPSVSHTSPLLINPDNKEEGSVDEYSSSHLYTLDNSKGTTDGDFKLTKKNAAAPSWPTTLTMEVQGPAKQFVVEGSGAIASRLSSLSFTGNQTTLTTFNLTDVAAKCTQLTKVKLPDAKLEKIYQQPKSITSINATTQTPQIPAVSVQGDGTDNHVSIPKVLASSKLLSNNVQDGFVVSVEAPLGTTIYRDKEATDYQKVIFYDVEGKLATGQITLKVQFKEASPYYGTTVVFPINLNEPAFNWTVDATECTYKLYRGTKELTATDKVKKDEKLKLVLTPSHLQDQFTGLTTEGLSWDISQLTSPVAENTFEFTVDGDKAPKITVVYTHVDPPVDPPKPLALVTLSQSEGGTVKVVDHNNKENVVGKYFSADQKPFTMTVTPEFGYVVDKVFFNNEKIDLDAKNQAKLQVVATNEVKINPIVVMFKRAATFKLVYDNKLVTPTFQVVDGTTKTNISTSTTYAVGLPIIIAAEPKNPTVEIDQILLNGAKYEIAKPNKTLAGVNYIEVTTRSILATGIDVIGAGTLKHGTDFQFYGGATNTKIGNYDDISALNLVKGDPMKLTFNSNTLKNKKLKVTDVYINGKKVAETNGEYVHEFVAGRNTVTINSETTAATISVNSGETLNDEVVTFTVNGADVKVADITKKEYKSGDPLVIKFNKNKLDAQRWKESAVYLNGTQLTPVGDDYTFQTNLVAGLNVISVHSISTRATLSMNSNAAFGNEGAITFFVKNQKVTVAQFATKDFLVGDHLIIKIKKSQMDVLKLEETKIHVNKKQLDAVTTSDPDIVQYETDLEAGQNVISIYTESTKATVSMNSNVAFKDKAVTYTIDGKDVTEDQFATYETLAGKELVVTFNKKLMDEQRLKETHLYVNETKINGKETETEITFTYKLLAGRNIISIHTESTRATLSMNSDVTFNNGVVSFKVNNAPVAVAEFATKDFLVDDELLITINKNNLYNQKLKLTSIYLNSTLLTPVAETATVRTYKATLKAGENVVTLHTMDVTAIVNLMPHDGKAGTVLYYYDKDESKVAADGDKKEADEILYVKPEIIETEYKYITVTQNNQPITPNAKGIYEIPLVSGNNNIFVSFSKEKPGSMKVILNGAKGEITDVWVHEKESTNGDIPMNEPDSTFSNLPTKNAINISFVAPAPTILNKQVSVVLNAKAYTPTYNEDKKCYEIKEDIYLLSRGPSVLRIDVKTLRKITLVQPDVKTFVYNGNPQAPTFTTKVGTKDVYFDDFTLEYQTGDGLQTISKPTNVGKYRLKIMRPADNEYVAFEDKIEFEITKAPLIVVRMPSISITWTNAKAAQAKENPEPWKGDFKIGTDGKVGFKTPSGYQTVKGEFTFFGSDKYEEGKMTKDWVGLKFEVDANDQHVDNITWDKTKELSAFYTVGSPVKTEYQTKPQLTISKVKDSEPFIGKRASDLILIDPAMGYNVKVQNAGITTFNLSTDEELVPGVRYQFQLVSTSEHATEIGEYTGTPINYPITSDVKIRLVKNDMRSTLALTSDVANQTFTYDGTPKVFDYKKLQLDATNAMEKNSKWTVTYSQNGVNIPEPIDAGTYTVTIVRAADALYTEFKTTGKLIINKMKLSGLFIESPEATPIAEGAPLSTSQLKGAAEIVGSYVWRDPSIVPSRDGSGGNRQDVQFKPFDTKNYDTPYNAGDAFLTFLPKQDVITWTAELGTITVSDANGANVQNGTAITKGMKYNIVATPLYPGKVEFSSMTINGKSYGSTASVTADGENSIVIYAVFTLIQPKDPDPIYVYDTHIVNMPNFVRGASVSKTGPHEVKHNESFEFTVKTLDADTGKVVVRVDGSVLPKENGKYTIKNITSQRTVTINLPNPTEINLDVKEKYHSAMGNTLATVQLVNNTSNDGKYYFNDNIQVIAFPASGIEFKSWSDGNKNQVRNIHLSNPELVLRLNLSGELVGVEDIEVAKVYAGTGCVIVKGATNAQITVTTFTGKAQAVREVAGDAVIAVPAGSYIVTLEDGAVVQRVKLIVK